jgi:general stress protein 26
MSEENLKSQEAIEKLKKMVDSIDIGMVCSRPGKDGEIHAVPMSRQEVDEEGNIWYLFNAESETHANLSKNPHITILFSDIKAYEFLSLDGHAEIFRDQERIDKYWNKFMEAWFEKGKEDPSIRVLKVITDEAYYWDNKSNKVVTFMKVAASAISGKKMDIGRSGELDL